MGKVLGTELRTELQPALIGELDEISETFVQGSNLQFAAESLDKMLSGEKLDTRQIEILRWAGILWGQMEWNSKHFNAEPIVRKYGNLAVVATSLRPLFYQKVEQLNIPLTKDYSERVYQALRFFDVGQLPKGELSRIRQLLYGLGKELHQKLDARAMNSSAADD